MSKLIQISTVAAEFCDFDVVFVHGLGGDGLQTWGNPQEKTSFWPNFFSVDFPAARVWSFDYDAPISRWFGSAMPLSERAVNAIAHFLAQGIGARPIFFVCHSLGGLVVKQLIRSSCDKTGGDDGVLARATGGVTFLSTPHQGSQFATWLNRLGGVFLSSRALRQLSRADEQLRNLNTWYRRNAPGLQIRHKVFYENKPYKGVLVVSPDVADPNLQDVVPVPLDDDHVSIAKPRSRESLQYTAVVEMIGTGQQQPLVQAPESQFLAAGSSNVASSVAGREVTLAQLMQELARNKWQTLESISARLGVSRDVALTLVGEADRDALLRWRVDDEDAEEAYAPSAKALEFLESESRRSTRVDDG